MVKRIKHFISSIIIVVTLCAVQFASAKAPQGYYNSLEGKKDGELKTAIYELIRDITKTAGSNDQIYSALSRTFQKTDLYPNSDRWWDMYSDLPLYAPSFKGLNREHSFPKSWWGGSTTINAYIDLNHLYPSEMSANSAKSNYPLGIVDSSHESFNNGVCKVGSPIIGQGGGAKKVFEPADEYKGDFARTYFYMVTCYQDLTWNSKYSYMLSPNLYPTLQSWASKMLMQWANDDPVSQKELDRNDAVFDIQNNRNPFIDLPELADYLWGDKVGQPFKIGNTPTEPTGDPTLITPTQGMILDFGETAIGSDVTSRLLFRGENLTGTIDLAITGDNKTMFTLPSNSLNTSQVNTAEGTWLTITYSPSAIGKHTAKLIISKGGILGGSREVELTGECFAVPTLTACTATDATDITENSYRANWTYPTNEAIDYWIITRTIYTNGSNVATKGIVAEEPGTIIDGFNDSDSESYAVQSVRLGYRSPMSNVIFVNHNSITGVETDHGLVIQGFDGYLRFICSAPQSGACIYNATGSLVRFIDKIDNNTDIEMPSGVYIVTTDYCHTPIKVIVR